MKAPIRLVGALFALAVGLRAADPALPAFNGFIASPSSGTLFALVWQAPDGRKFQAWLRLREKAGEFTLASFDAETETLSLEDSAGQRHRLALPQGKVRPATLTDQEYAALHRFVENGANWSEAPTLSRDQARAFYFRLIRQRATPGESTVVFDLDGSTLSPARRATWEADKIKARQDGKLLLAVVVDGETKVMFYPLRSDPMPQPMVRNLLDSDWEEIALLDAMNTLKGIGGRKK